jgi:hypothetical protein
MREERKWEMKNELCTSCKYRIAPDGWAACDGCIHDEGLKDRYEPMTNADRIRNMTDEELAEVLADFVVRQGCSPDDICSCANCWLKWLRSPVEESEK